MAGSVGNYMSIRPERVVLTGHAGEPISETVKIVPETKPQFEILAVRTLAGSNVRCRLERNENDAEKISYTLFVENLKTTPGRYFDRIFLDTNYEKKSEFTITVTGHIKPSLENN